MMVVGGLANIRRTGTFPFGSRLPCRHAAGVIDENVRDDGCFLSIGCFVVDAGREEQEQRLIVTAVDSRRGARHTSTGALDYEFGRELRRRRRQESSLKGLSGEAVCLNRCQDGVRS